MSVSGSLALTISGPGWPDRAANAVSNVLQSGVERVIGAGTVLDAMRRCSSLS